MPGPRNQKKHRGSEAKRPKKKGAAKGVIAASLAYAEVVEIPPTNAVAVSPKAASVPDASLRALSLETAYVGSLGPNDASDLAIHASSPPTAPHSPPLRTPSSPSGNYDEGFPPPCIEDPGSGPRVRDAVAFLSSPFAVRSADETDAPLCAELAQGEVLSMVREVLPEELAIMVWYNRTRRSSRICPACQRLYTLGDVLPEHFSTAKSEEGQYARMGQEKPSPQLDREQALSGLCSAVCFALSLYNFPHAVHMVWGASGTAPWRRLITPSRQPPAVDGGLGLAVRMTRRADLGLGLLLGLSDDIEPEYEDGGWDEWNTT